MIVSADGGGVDPFAGVHLDLGRNGAKKSRVHVGLGLQSTECRELCSRVYTTIFGRGSVEVPTPTSPLGAPRLATTPAHDHNIPVFSQTTTVNQVRSPCIRKVLACLCHHVEQENNVSTSRTVAFMGKISRRQV